MWTKGYRDLWHWAEGKETTKRVAIANIRGGPTVFSEWEAVGVAACGSPVAGHEAFVSRDGRERTCRRCSRAAAGLTPSAIK